MIESSPSLVTFLNDEDDDCDDDCDDCDDDYDDDGNGKIERYIGEFCSLPVNVGVNTNIT